MPRPSKRKRILLVVTASLISLFVVGFVAAVLALPSGGSHPPTFYYSNGMWYDAWDVTRNAWYGEDGYLPQMANESLGTNRELAYGWGQEFEAAYPSRVERAQEILKYVQRWVKYGHDWDHVTMGGEAQEEWAWNADEMAHKIDEAKSSYSVARGDCEDFSFLCSILYLGAGFEVAIASPRGHVALLIWLPEYPDANIYWDIGDGKGHGWIWVEATGDKNRLGWTPPDFDDGKFDVYIIRDLPSLEISEILFEPTRPTPESDVTVTTQVKVIDAEISLVTLIYYLEGETATNNVPMHHAGEITYTATIPKQGSGVTINFYIQASDTVGRIAKSHETSYTVKSPILGLEPEILGLGIIVVCIIILLLAKS